MASEPSQPGADAAIEELKPLCASGDASVEVKPTPDNAALSVVYAVCIAHLHELAVPTGGFGFEPTQRMGIEVVGDLGVLTITVDAAYFMGPEAEERLADLAWVAPRAIRHEELIRGASHAGPVMPLPFGTIFSSVSSMRAAIESFGDVVRGYLDRVRGCVELGLRAAMDRPKALAALVAQLSESRHLPASPGARYLMQKRLNDEAQRTLDAAMTAQIEELIAAIEPLTRGVVARRAAADRGDGLETVGLLALLVPNEDVACVRERVAEMGVSMQVRGVQLEITGPWSAYSFCPSLGAAS